MSVRSMPQLLLPLCGLLLSFRDAWSSCAYRGIRNLPPKAFSYWGNWGCYIYIRPDLFDGYPLIATSCKITVDQEDYDVPGITFNDTCVPFDFTDDRIKRAAEKTLKSPTTVVKWMECSLDAQECCTKVMKNSVPAENHCPAVWDAWSCFESTPVGETYTQVCSRYAYAAQPPRCHHFSHKECYNNGTWRDKTDYSGCDITPKLKFRQNWHIATLVISILFCTPAALALVVHNTQNFAIIRNLVFSIIIRNVLLILVKSIIIIDELSSGEFTVMSENNWPCKLLAFFEKLSGNAVFACMLLEGFYLHQLLTNAFRTRQGDGVNMTPFYIGCSILTVGSALAWACIMAVHYDANCWQVTEGTDFSWILGAPRLVMLIVNSGLLVHIIWRLWSAFRTNDAEEHPAIRTGKAALICFPLFGIPFFFVIVHPNTTSCGLEQFFYFTSYSIESLQGVCIVIFHCYREREIKRTFAAFYGVIRNYWDKKTGKRGRLGENAQSEQRVTARSHMETTGTENRTPRITNATKAPFEEILSTPTEQRLVRIEGVASPQQDMSRFKENDHLEGSRSASLRNSRTDESAIRVNCEISLDPKILFKNRSEDIVLLDPDEKKA